jgi:hypothetical protein
LRVTKVLSAPAGLPFPYVKQVIPAERIVAGRGDDRIHAVAAPWSPIGWVPPVFVPVASPRVMVLAGSQAIGLARVAGWTSTVRATDHLRDHPGDALQLLGLIR